MGKRVRSRKFRNQRSIAFLDHGLATIDQLGIDRQREGNIEVRKKTKKCHFDRSRNVTTRGWEVKRQTRTAELQINVEMFEQLARQPLLFTPVRQSFRIRELEFVFFGRKKRTRRAKKCRRRH